MISTRDALDALMVAHDALLEGRDHHAATTDAPLWARSDRLLPDIKWWTHRTATEILNDLQAVMEEYFGPTVDLSENTILGSLIAIHADQAAKLWELTTTVSLS